MNMKTHLIAERKSKGNGIENLEGSWGHFRFWTQTCNRWRAKLMDSDDEVKAWWQKKLCFQPQTETTLTLFLLNHKIKSRYFSENFRSPSSTSPSSHMGAYLNRWTLSVLSQPHWQNTLTVALTQVDTPSLFKIHNCHSLCKIHTHTKARLLGFTSSTHTHSHVLTNMQTHFTEPPPSPYWLSIQILYFFFLPVDTKRLADGLAVRPYQVSRLNL